jgi:predicted Fe-Mo cluster-binding NifX family protein
MKIAIPTEGADIFQHFGKSENLTIVEIENSEIKNKSVINTEGNQHGQLPAFLASKGINTVIAGGMGDGARERLAFTYVDMNNLEYAIKEFAALATEDPSSTIYSGNLALLYVKSNKYNEARRVINALEAVNPAAKNDETIKNIKPAPFGRSIF